MCIRDSSYLDAAALAKALLQQIQEGLFEGSGSCIGMPALRAGETVAIRGVGRRFSGTYLLSQVRHTIDDGGYRTEFDTTQRWTSTLLASLRGKLSDSGSGSAAPRQPPAQGVWVATVTRDVDPEGLGRVQVNFPELSDEDDSAWARVATFAASGKGDGTAGWGGWFPPRRGDEVLVAFEHGDVDRPVVIGALWHRKSPPPHRPRAGSGITTRTGMAVLFDEAAGDMRIEHPKGSSIVLADDGTITITAAEGLKLAAGKDSDITLEANHVWVKVNKFMDVS